MERTNSYITDFLVNWATMNWQHFDVFHGLDDATVQNMSYVSDHTPCDVMIRFNPLVPLRMLEKCADGNFCYNSHDKSTKLKPKIRLDNIYTTPLMIGQFNELAIEITNSIRSKDPLNRIAGNINERIYEIC